MLLLRTQCLGGSFPGACRPPASVHHSISRPVCQAAKDIYTGKPIGESPDEALERRLRESERVEQRVVDVHTTEELDAQFKAAGNKLVVIEIQSDGVCELGFDEPELHWEADRIAAEEARLAKCQAVKHVFQRTARDCGDVHFVSVHANAEASCELCDRLEIEVLPTLQFYRNGMKLWEHKGANAAEQDLGEGVLFYGDAAGKGVRGSDFVQELWSSHDMENFVREQPRNMLTVINVALESATPCVRIFPAVMALAKNFKGHAVFGRLIGDAVHAGSNPEAIQELMKRYNILEVPTFLFFRNGKQVGRHVGSSRGDLIGQILQQQAAAGIKPPPPPPGAVKRRIGKVAAPAPKQSAWR